MQVSDTIVAIEVARHVPRVLERQALSGDGQHSHSMMIRDSKLQSGWFRQSEFPCLENRETRGTPSVYKAEDLTLGRHFALKFQPEQLANDPQTLSRFAREAT